MRVARGIVRRTRSWARDESGFITVQNLFLLMVCCAIGAAGLDVTSFYQARTHLQVAADIGAHSAIYTRHHGRTNAQAASAAVAAASYGVPAGHGTILTSADIEFGNWNASTRTFTPLSAGSSSIPSAARVVTNRADDNPVGSFLFRIVGIDEMDVSTGSIYTVYYPGCLSEGFIAEGVVDIQSNNSFLRGFCLHSNDHVETNQNNYFEQGTIVSMPDKSDLVTPASGFTQNVGLQQALRDATYDLKELDRLDPAAKLEPGVLDYEAAVTTVGHDRALWFLESSVRNVMTPGSYGPSNFVQNSVNYVDCSKGGNKTLTLTGGTYSRMVIFTECPVKLSGQVAMEDVVLYTTNTGSKSISASSGSAGLTLGRNDGCAERGGATILSRGGMEAAAKLQMYGGQVRVLGDFKFASGGGGGTDVTGEGVSVMARGVIDGTTHMNISGCPVDTMDPRFDTAFFALAE